MEKVNRKKILFLVTQSEMGGAQRYIYEVSKVLAERHEILIVAGEGDGELFRKISKLKTQNSKLQLKTQKLKNLRRTPNPYRIIAAMAEIIRLLKKEKPDVLFLCSTTAGLLGSIAGFVYRNLVSKKETKFQIIYRIGGWAFRDPRAFWKNWLIFWLEKLTARFKDLIIVNSEYDWRIAVEKRIVFPEKIVKIYNGINVDSLEFLSRKQAREKLWESDSHNLWIGCVTNFYRTKGLEYLIGGFDSLMSDFPRKSDIKLFVIGDGKERPKLETLIKKYGLENQVILAGRIADAYKYLKAFDVFVLPSLKEGFPWVILEAMAAGIPIIATKVGAIPEILPEEFLVEPADADALAKKISRMLEHPAVPKLKQEFTLQKMVESTERALQTNQSETRKR